MRTPTSINLCKPSIGLYFEHSYHNGRAKAQHDFKRDADITKFEEWLWSEPIHEHCRRLAPASKQKILTDAMKPSWFTRYHIANDYTLMGYSLDINWKKNNEWKSNGAHKDYGFVK